MSHNRTISVIGLGYVGLPVAVAFGLQGKPVIAFDINLARIQALARGHDHTGEMESAELARASLTLSTNPEDLRQADFHIITVPTPIDEVRRPDLRPLLSATRTVGKVLKKGDIVVYESTVYPGATEEECVPLLERESGLVYGTDFHVGYSPERINPGDREHRFTTIQKIVSGSDPLTLDIVAQVYGSVVMAGVHRAPSIQVAEAAKVIENTQRDLNIALMNELSLIFDRLGIDTLDVLKAAQTKWNFLPFTPGLVGGHCIGVDPYYLTHCAERVGLHPQIILAGRRINDAMGTHVARETVRHLLTARPRRDRLRVSVLGLTFKEDVPDIRNTRVIDIVHELRSFGVEVQIHDPVANPAEVAAEYGLTLVDRAGMKPADAVILAVPHAAYRQEGWPLIQSLLENRQGLVADVKGVLERSSCPSGVVLWRL